MSRKTIEWIEKPFRKKIQKIEKTVNIRVKLETDTEMS